MYGEKESGLDLRMRQTKANFAQKAFSEVAPALVTPSYLRTLYNVQWV
jgi:hypothetical protein